MSLTIPGRLQELLRCPGDADVEGATVRLVSRVATVLGDNKMPFFPSYTDHGVRHVEAVLSAAEELIPEKVWEDELLEQADAVVLIGGTLLHDLALHVREQGFLELVAPGSRFEPLPWFCESHAGRDGDAPWPELWQAFRKEARHFGYSQLGRILGPGATTPAVVAGDHDQDPTRWTEPDRLLIGEFLRRHHARLAHEIAIYGFPGLTCEEFEPVSKSLPGLADAIGLTARSHNEDLRCMGEYLAYRARGEGRPFGAVVPFLMGLLRVADYFQLDSGRASPLLMHLREPQSPASAAEWRKHQAIERISWLHRKDPKAVNIQVSADLSISIYLQLQELVEDLQREIDMTTAILGETYGRSELAALELSRKRVDTNLADPGLIDQLRFVPMRARPRSAEDLFRLVIADLYGNEPAIAGRELLQNAVDAVRELRRALAGGATPAAPVRDLPAEVLVEVREIDDQRGVLRVADAGIGMTPGTIIDNFLSAGAVVHGEAAEDPPDSAAAIAWMKTGRFGLGAFAAFLLGDEIKVTTRHFREPRGVTFTAEYDDELVQLDWAGDEVPVGTEIEVPFRDDALRGGDVWTLAERIDRLLKQTASYLQLRSPSVVFRVVHSDGNVSEFDHDGEIPDPTQPLPAMWRSSAADGYDAVLWRLPPKPSKRLGDTFAGGPRGARLAHNGMVVRPVVDHQNMAYQWSDQWLERNILHPTLAVFDSRHLLGITLNRYELTERTLPFEGELLASIGEDVVARGLALGPTPHPLGKFWGLRPVFTRTGWLPFLPGTLQRLVDQPLLVLLTTQSDIGGMEILLADVLDGEQSWKQFPYRVVLPTALPGSPWRSPRETIPKRIWELEKRLGLEVSVSGYWSFDGGPPRYQPLRTSGGERAGAMEEYFLTLEDQVRQLASGDEIGMVLLRRAKGPFPLDPLAQPWIEAVAGPLPVGPSARAVREEKITEGFPRIAERIERWKELAERDGH